MRSALFAAAGLACISFTGLSTGASAAPAGLSTLPAIEAGSAATKVDYSNYCRRWRHECANRWGWGTWRFRRCLSIHGCL